jgi:TetR/AcrR family transcriptional regulator, regulator of cefoperazone and chloramphenicol sensitivity
VPNRTGRQSRIRHKIDDELTRTRLLDAAGPIFAAEGFHWAKVRDICARAEANVAAVNYHFGDKLGLYTEVLRYSVSAVPNPIPSTNSSDVPPEARLRGFIRMILDCVFNSSRPAWHMKLVLQEMSHPTPAIDELVEQFIRPRYQMLCSLIGTMIGQSPKARITQLCAHSVVGQARHYLIANAVIGKVWPELTFAGKDLDEIADHITVFSLAGIKAAGKTLGVTKTTRKRRPVKGPESNNWL